VVRLAVHKRTGLRYAVKTILKSRLARRVDLEDVRPLLLGCDRAVTGTVVVPAQRDIDSTARRRWPSSTALSHPTPRFLSCLMFLPHPSA
jgi:hypothetical protein